MWKHTGTKKPGSKKFGWKQFWNKIRPNRKTNAAPKGEISQEGNSLPNSRVVKSTRADGNLTDIHELDKDRIRTCCQETLQNPPEFPSREEVKERIENAHRYYGIKCVFNHHDESEDTNEKKDLQPSWYYILERPLVEQYVLMNNYIRKLSVMASLKKEQSGAEEEPAIEEEVSSISSSSDYADFAPDSKIAAKLKEINKLGANPSLPSQGGARLERELLELKTSTKGEERIIKTNEYTIIIREPAKLGDGHNVEKVLPSASNALEFGATRGRLEDEHFEVADQHDSGDHLPDMSDFDLSCNLVDGPVEIKRGFGRPQYYHWRGNSTPTKTPLLNMDCQPPVRPRAPGTARDFLSFRSLSLSSEFVDSCRDYSVAFSQECRSAYLKELTGPGDSEDDLEGHASSGTQTEHKNVNPRLSLTWEGPTESCCALLAETNPIGERAALASEYIRECGNQDVNCVDEIIVGKIDSTDASHESAGHVVGYLDDDDLLRTSVSQIDIAGCSESESASSIETQILAVPAKLD